MRGLVTGAGIKNPQLTQVIEGKTELPTNNRVHYIVN